MARSSASLRRTASPARAWAIAAASVFASSRMNATSPASKRRRAVVSAKSAPIGSAGPRTHVLMPEISSCPTSIGSGAKRVSAARSWTTSALSAMSVYPASES
jgi:hypothetical protein